MFRIRCRYTKARLTAYIKRELPTAQRRYIARHLDTCERCQHLHQQQTQLMRELEYELARFATPKRTQLDMMWANIQHQMQTTTTNKQVKPMSLQLGMVAIFALLMMSLPFLMGNHNIDPRFATHQGVTRIVNVTPSATPTSEQSRAVAYIALTEPVMGTLDTNLQNTPDPNLSNP